MSYTYFIANNKFFSYLTGGTAIGDLDTAVSSGVTSGTTNDEDYSGYTYTPYVVTGGSTSRLSELKKYVITSVFANQYVGGGNTTNDGVDYANSIPNVKVVYYLGGIRYTDIISGTSTITAFSFTTLGITSPSFINVPIYKDPKKENIISNPKIDDDVFIIRQELSAFENNYRLENVRKLVELETYAGGKYFNIINNK